MWKTLEYFYNVMVHMIVVLFTTYFSISLPSQYACLPPFFFHSSVYTIHVTLCNDLRAPQELKQDFCKITRGRRIYSFNSVLHVIVRHYHVLIPRYYRYSLLRHLRIQSSFTGDVWLTSQTLLMWSREKSVTQNVSKGESKLYYYINIINHNLQRESSHKSWNLEENHKSLYAFFAFLLHPISFRAKKNHIVLLA